MRTLALAHTERVSRAMADDRAKASARIANLNALLSEAGAVAVHWQSPVFREHGRREAAKLFIPDAQEIGAGLALVGAALKTLLHALARAHTDEAHRHIAVAMRSLVEAARVEPARKPADPTPVRHYWADR
jgi:hypothetical protein